MHVKQFKLMDLLEEVTAGNIVIPDFQRDFVWERNQIEELLSSVLNGYFVGTILLLESPAATPQFAPRHVFGAPKASPRGETFKYILDGQQRITSLYYAFYEPELELPDDVSATRRSEEHTSELQSP